MNFTNSNKAFKAIIATMIHKDMSHPKSKLLIPSIFLHNKFFQLILNQKKNAKFGKKNSFLISLEEILQSLIFCFSLLEKSNKIV